MPVSKCYSFFLRVVWSQHNETLVTFRMYGIGDIGSFQIKRVALLQQFFYRSTADKNLGLTDSKSRRLNGNTYKEINKHSG